MKRQTTQRIDVLGQYRYNILQVLWLTGMRESELMDMIMEAGVTWLLTYTKENDEEFVRICLHTDDMRSFWLNEWCRRDNRQFLAALYNMPATACAARYKALHTGVLFNPQHPDYNSFCDAFSGVMYAVSDVIKSKATCR